MTEQTNKKIKKLLLPFIGLIALIVIGVIIISLNPDLVKNISQKTNLTPSSSSSQTSAVEVKKTTYSYGDFPDFRLLYPVDWQIGSISTKQFSITKKNVKAVITLEVPSVSGLTSITCNTQTVKINDKITRVLPIGRSEYIYLPTSRIYQKGSEKYNDVIKSIDLSKSKQSEKDSYANSDSCGTELFTALTKTKLPPNSGINSPAGQGWFRMVVSGTDKDLLKELDDIISQITGLYWE